VTGKFRNLLLIVGLLGWTAGDGRASSVDAESILPAIVWMDHAAGLAHSARAEFTVTYLPTSEEEMQRISAFCEFRGYDYRASGYHLSERRAERRSYHSRWWREGVKEREVRTNTARPAIIETTVFDGQLVRTLDATPGRTRYYVASPETHWTHKSRVQPFTFAFEYRSSPHGDIVRESPERRVVRRRMHDRGCWEVTAQHPADDRLRLRMVFDDQRRLIEREAILTRSSSFMELDGEEPAVYSRWEFSSFRPYDDGRGHRIWFPTKAMLRFYLGNLPDGSPVQSLAMQIEVNDIQFNVDVPDEMFTLAAPEGVPVQDQRDGRYSVIAVSY
jgi:hypothetical protein